MSKSRSPKRCGLNKPGHDPHWIQASRATGDRDDPRVPGRLVDVGDDGSVLIELEGGEAHLWHHDPGRLAEVAAAADGAVSYRPRWGLLWVANPSGNYAFCVAKTLGDFISCPTEVPTGTPAEFLEKAGGFTISIEELMRNEKT